MNAQTGTTRALGLTRSVPELVIAGIAAIMIVFEVFVGDPGGSTAGRAVAGLVAALSLAFLRVYPFAAFMVNGMAVYALVALGNPSEFYQWTNLIALFAVAGRTNLPKALSCLVLGCTGVVTYFLRFPDEGPAALAFAVLAIYVAGWFAGRAHRARTRQIETKQQYEVARAELAAQQSRAELEAERGRIAQELHDVVGHAVNVMVVHAGAGQGLTSDDVKAKEIFRTIAATGRTALADLDRMLDVLQGNAGRSPVPGLTELEALCGAVRSTGLDVDLSVGDEAKDVSPSVGLAAYRIVQEALTNVIKHAHATAVRVEVGRATGTGTRNERLGDVAITVRDNGSGGQAVPGRGLRSIAARAALHGGSAQYGPTDEGGFEVSVRVPVESTT